MVVYNSWRVVVQTKTPHWHWHPIVKPIPPSAGASMVPLLCCCHPPAVVRPAPSSLPTTGTLTGCTQPRGRVLNLYYLQMIRRMCRSAQGCVPSPSFTRSTWLCSPQRPPGRTVGVAALLVGGVFEPSSEIQNSQNVIEDGSRFLEGRFDNKGTRGNKGTTKNGKRRYSSVLKMGTTDLNGNLFSTSDSWASTSQGATYDW